MGALYVRRGVELEPLVSGVGHAGGRRAGTDSALLVAALGQAAELAQPLTEVRGYAELLLDGDYSEEQAREFLERIAAAAERAGNLTHAIGRQGLVGGGLRRQPGASGRRTVKVLPRPSWLLTSMLPPCCWTI